MESSGNSGYRKIDQPVIYEIKVQGHLDKSWSGWLEGMVIRYENNSTILTGQMIDQAALRGLLNKVWDLNQTLISVNQVAMSEHIKPDEAKHISLRK